jgi:hypothetical protein
VLRTAGIEPDGRFGPTLTAHARRALEIFITAIGAPDGKASDVMRFRICITDVTNWRVASEVHSELSNFAVTTRSTPVIQNVNLVRNRHP